MVAMTNSFQCQVIKVAWWTLLCPTMLSLITANHQPFESLKSQTEVQTYRDEIVGQNLFETEGEFERRRSRRKKVPVAKTRKLNGIFCFPRHVGGRLTH